MKKIVKFPLIILSICFSFGCSENKNPGDPALFPATPPPKSPTKSKKENIKTPEICSVLDFQNATWPAHFTEMDKMALSLALNVSGSFEGHSGWANLSNNFDGQGFSMGILNQNLGQNSIQPLFISMRDHHLSVLQKYFSADMLDSMLKMLENWEERQPGPEKPKAAQLSNFWREPVLVYDENIDKKYGISGFRYRVDQPSVNWASNTLYTDSKGRNFKPIWKEALKGLAADPVYVSLQIAAAQELHDQARGDQTRLKWEQIRSYLYLFDLVVQNGGLKEKHFIKYEDWLTEQTQASEEERMLQMLEIRVVDSHPKWQKDVRLRKTAVILGTGHVHGEDRDLPVEYCYDQMLPYLN